MMAILAHLRIVQSNLYPRLSIILYTFLLLSPYLASRRIRIVDMMMLLLALCLLWRNNPAYTQNPFFIFFSQFCCPSLIGGFYAYES